MRIDYSYNDIPSSFLQLVLKAWQVRHSKPNKIKVAIFTMSTMIPANYGIVRAFALSYEGK